MAQHDTTTPTTHHDKAAVAESKHSTALATEDAPGTLAASSQVITDIGTVISTGPTAATSAKAIAASGPIMDYIGNTKEVLLKFQEANTLLQLVIAATDASDPNLTTLNNILTTLS